MFYIFLDTNLFVADFQFNSQFNRRLLKYAKRGDITLCITYTNYMEIVKKYKDRITPYLNKVKEGNAEFQKVTGFYIIDDSIKTKEYVRKYKDFLDNLIAENNIKIVHHSNDFSGKLIQKFFENKKPFDVGKPAFQDAIIWETISDFYDDNYDMWENRVFFLTQNIKDFGKTVDEGNGDYRLHENLLNEAPELKLLKNAQEFFDYEGDNLHDYIIDSFQLDETNTIQLIKDYLESINDIELEIDHYLSNHEFQGEYFSGWGESSYSILDTIEIIEASKEADTGVIELICNLNYKVDFTISTPNPIYDAFDTEDDAYLSEENGEEIFCITANISIQDGEIATFNIDETQII